MRNKPTFRSDLAGDKKVLAGIKAKLRPVLADCGPVRAGTVAEAASDASLVSGSAGSLGRYEST